MENEVLERCYNDFMPSGRCTLPRGHQGLCVSPAEAEVERLKAAAKWLISEAYWFQCEGGWDDPEGHGDVRPEAIRPTIEALCKEMWPKPLLPSVKAEAKVPRATDSAGESHAK